MKLTASFKSFLQDTVNLNEARITSLENSVEAIKKFIRQSDYAPSFVEFQEQGSWAHDTIIKPLSGDEFDADLLLVVEPVDGWGAGDYVAKLGKIFSDSATYKDKTKIYDFCVTIVYAGDKRIDIAPLVKDRGGLVRYEVCDRGRVRTRSRFIAKTLRLRRGRRRRGRPSGTCRSGWRPVANPSSART